MTQKSRSKKDQFLPSMISERAVLYRQMHRVRSTHTPKNQISMEELSSLTICDP